MSPWKTICFLVFTILCIHLAAPPGQAENPFGASKFSVQFQDGTFQLTIAEIMVGGTPYWARWTLNSAIGWDLESFGEFPGPQSEAVMATPYVNEADMADINEAFSADANAPWGFAHDGIDFFPKGNGAAFQAVFTGTVHRIDTFLNTGNNKWQVNVDIRFNDRYGVGYAFEPAIPGASAGDQQAANIMVSVGQIVIAGDVIGTLYKGAEGAHVHFGFFIDGQAVCPETYFSSSARESIRRVLHTTWPNAEICY